MVQEKPSSVRRFLSYGAKLNRSNVYKRTNFSSHAARPGEEEEETMPSQNDTVSSFFFFFFSNA
jgi:hypothetical protein